MDVKRRKYDLLLSSFDPNYNMFKRDEELISKIPIYIEKDKSKQDTLDSIYDEISSLSATINNDSISDRIYASIDKGESFDTLLEELKEEKFDVNIVQKMYNEYKKYCELENQEISEFQVIRDLTKKHYTKDVALVINNSISNYNIDLVKETINNYNIDLIKRIIVSYLFEDVPENFLINLDNMLSFQLKVDKEFIKPDILDIYKTIMSLFKSGSLKQLVDLFNQLKETKIDFKSEFYDNYKEARKIMAEDLMNVVYKVNDEYYSVIDGVKCYTLTGEPFYMMIHASTDQITDFSRGLHDGTSMSFISNDRLNVYNKNVIYGFDNLKPEQFIEMYTHDTATQFDMETGTKSMLNAVPRFYTPKEFINNTKEEQYNEVLYLTGKGNNEKIETPKPSYIVCMDNINEDSIEVARKLNIPIVIIMTKYYPNIKPNPFGHFAFFDEQEVYKTIDLDEVHKKI